VDTLQSTAVHLGPQSEHRTYSKKQIRLFKVDVQETQLHAGVLS
jgi:hypothetical protein